MTPAAKKKLLEKALELGISAEGLINLAICNSLLLQGANPVKVEEIVGGQYLAEDEFIPAAQVRLGG